MFNKIKTCAFILSAALLLAPSAQADKTNVAVAANFTAAAKDIAKAFEAETGFEAVLSFGSTGKLYAQILHGAPFTVFLAADVARPEKLENEGQAVMGSRFTYAKGKIVLYSAFDDFFGRDPLSDLASDKVNRIAIANPKTAPYGLAAQTVLEKAGLMEAVQNKIIRGESIAQTYQFVATQNAETGFVAMSQIVKTEGGSKWVVPESDYAPIAQQAVLLKSADNDPVAKAFITFLKGESAKAIIQSYGYGIE